ncbi:hypothetical protein EST38_g1317 [Candolleomyces aberdarensis]|uniref:Uncharacterized protein n=1 Tax=Candolleomyces aberdarensis TaxID=2316362 RepID=A0A4Q2DVR5_9AGAR|nr:hypothetical protein EST38_g1317 [Candolleomyces aberdarensis]
MPHSEHHLHPSRASSQAEREKRRLAPSKTPSASSTTTTKYSSSRSKRHEDGDDKASISSKSTHPAKGPRGVEALRDIAGERVRHSKCPPEYLEAIAPREDEQVNIISGNEASTFFVKFLGGGLDNDVYSLRSNSSRVESQAIVFAVTAWNHDRKCVDYYMTWRGKSKHFELPEQEVSALDDEFRRVARRIDNDYKAFRMASDYALMRAAGQDSQPLPEPPVSATSSVISLPYLNMIRGVPRGNRLALMVTNPDRMSMVSEVDTLVFDPSAIQGVMLDSEGAAFPVIAITPPDKMVPPESLAASSGPAPVMKSSASVHSTETRSSRSSRSSQSDSPELDPDRVLNQFLIVLLGDKLEREGLSWHGLERQTSVRSQHRSFTKEEKVSPWTGPLAKADSPPRPHQNRRSLRRRSNESDSDSDGSYEEGHWKDSPVVPLKPLLESLGIISTSDPNISSPYPANPPMIPPFASYSTSMVASPGPSTMPQLGYAASNGSSRVSMNMNGPYVPAYFAQPRSGTGSPVSRPASRVLPPMAYAASPYMRPAY